MIDPSSFRNRRHLMRITAAAAAGTTLFASKASAGLLESLCGERHKRHAHCFLEGTRVRTPSCDRPIESLVIGDSVDTLVGPRSVKWIGKSVFERSPNRQWNKGVLPIRVARHALGPDNPRNDLYLSRDHSLYIADHFIPVKFLENGRSIVTDRREGIDRLNYYHIELDSHGVIFAEAAASESFLAYEDGVRERFGNFAEYTRLYGDASAAMIPFAPYLRYAGAADEVRALGRLAASKFFDARDPIQVAFDQIASRASEPVDELA